MLAGFCWKKNEIWEKGSVATCEYETILKKSSRSNECSQEKNIDFLLLRIQLSLPCKEMRTGLQVFFRVNKSWMTCYVNPDGGIPACPGGLIKR